MKCAMCGYDDAPKSQLETHIMNHYVSADGKRTIVLNCKDETFTTKPPIDSERQPETFTRADVYTEQLAAKQAKTPAPASATNPLKK
jgi:hypothetical protein